MFGTWTLLIAVAFYAAFDLLYEWLGLSTRHADVLACVSMAPLMIFWIARPFLIEWYQSRPRCKGTRGREFLLLLDKDVLKEVFSKAHPLFKFCLTAILIHLGLGFLFLLTTDKSGKWAYALASFTVGALHFVAVVCMLLPLRHSLLLPAYHRRRLAKARAEYETAIKTFNSGLPEDDFRTQALPRASLDTMDDLRVRVAEQRLPTELVPVAQRIGQTHAVLAEAELNLADSKANARLQTTT